MVWWTTIIKNWKTVAVLAVIIGLFGYIKLQQHNYNLLQDRHDEVIREYAVYKVTCETNVSSLKGAITEQNDSLRKLNEQLAEKDKIILKYRVDAEKKAVEHKKEIDELMNKPVPKTCEDSLNYLRDNIEVFKW